MGVQRGGPFQRPLSARRLLRTEWWNACVGRMCAASPRTFRSIAEPIYWPLSPHTETVILSAVVTHPSMISTSFMAIMSGVARWFYLRGWPAA